MPSPDPFEAFPVLFLVVAGFIALVFVAILTFVVIVVVRAARGHGTPVTGPRRPPGAWDGANVAFAEQQRLVQEQIIRDATQPPGSI